MTFKEKVQSDLEVYKRVLEKLKEYDCEDKAIAIVSGMIDGCENVLEGLKNEKSWFYSMYNKMHRPLLA